MYSGIIFILPELIISMMACFILIFDLFSSNNKKYIYYVVQFFLLFILFSLFYSIKLPRCILFDGAFVVDSFSIFLKIILTFVSFLVFIYSKKYLFYLNLFKSEFFVLCLLSILGMMILISSGDFITFYLGLELLSLPMYSLIIMNKSYLSSEASMKFFIMGSISSGLFLFGVSIIYGLTGLIELRGINFLITKGDVFSHMGILYGLVFIFFGLVFKFGAVPFHMWVPDVYEGSPIPVTLFLGTVPKIAALGMAYRLLSDSFSCITGEIEFLCLVIGILSLFVGNIFALTQSNIKRLLGYSAVSHVGFVFFSFIGANSNNFSISLFYIVIYVLSVLGVFGVIISVSSRVKEAELINDFSGIGNSHTVSAIIMAIFLFSLAGIPPTAGFYAKLFVLKNLISHGYVELSVFILLLSVIGAYYYLNIIKVMFFDSASDVVEILGVSMIGRIFIFLNGVIILFIGVYPSNVLNFCIF
jgi:NADH-quinone oxidoreductase subunit N